MRTESTAIPSPLGITSRARALWLRTATGALVATAINATIWASGRATDVPFTVRSVLDDATIRVGIESVVFATLFAFAAGSALLALAARTAGCVSSAPSPPWSPRRRPPVRSRPRRTPPLVLSLPPCT